MEKPDFERLFNERLSQSHLRQQLSWPDGDARRSCTRALELDLGLVRKDGGLALSLYASFGTDSLAHSRKNWWGREVDRCTVHFGIKRGRLCIVLLNGEAPPDGRYAPSMPDTLTIESKAGTGSSDTAAGKTGLAVSAKGPELSLGTEHTVTDSKSRETALTYAQPQITWDGDDDFPCWTFSSPERGQPLRGKAPGDTPPLAVISATGEPVKAAAAFLIDDDDLDIVELKMKPGTKRVKKMAVLNKALSDWLRAHALPQQGQMAVALAIATGPVSEVAGQLLPVEGAR